MQMTRWPLAKRKSHRCDPRKPAPPETTEVGMPFILASRSSSHNSPFDLDSAPFAASATDAERNGHWALPRWPGEREKSALERTHPARKRGAAPPVHPS